MELLTRYKLGITVEENVNKEESILEIENKVKELCEEGLVHEELIHIIDKWSDYKESCWCRSVNHIKLLSTSFPNVIFCFDITDNYNYNERYYVKNGKSKNAESRIVFSEFDESELR